MVAVRTITIAFACGVVVCLAVPAVGQNRGTTGAVLTADCDCVLGEDPG